MTSCRSIVAQPPQEVHRADREPARLALAQPEPRGDEHERPVVSLEPLSAMAVHLSGRPAAPAPILERSDPRQSHPSHGDSWINWSRRAARMTRGEHSEVRLDSRRSEPAAADISPHPRLHVGRSHGPQPDLAKPRDDLRGEEVGPPDPATTLATAPPANHRAAYSPTVSRPASGSMYGPGAVSTVTVARNRSASIFRANVRAR